jgi:hypothetical protein
MNGERKHRLQEARARGHGGHPDPNQQKSLPLGPVGSGLYFGGPEVNELQTRPRCGPHSSCFCRLDPSGFSEWSRRREPFSLTYQHPLGS